MRKMTKKYRMALNCALKINVISVANARPDQETLYSELQEKGHFWDSKSQEWQYSDPRNANKPSKTIMVRVWADLDVVEAVADELIAASKPQMSLIERSTVYPCRPPKQLEGRVYLKFIPRSHIEGEL